jgi:hypothetical protein
MRELTSDQNPGTRSPRVSKVDDKQPNHDYCRPPSRTVVRKVVNVLGEDDSNYKVGECHAESTHCQNGFTAQTVDIQDCWDGGNEHDYSDDSGSKK